MSKNDFHDPSEYIRGLQQVLVSDKKRIGFLFGAGTSLAYKDKNSLIVPAIGELTKQVVDELSTDKKNEVAFKGIKEELGESFNLESVLSNLEQKHGVIGNSRLNGLNKLGLSTLMKAFKRSVRSKVSVHEQYKEDIASSMVQVDFARWVGQAQRKHPVEIFTTNYDYLFELALEHWNIPYYDGFTGSYKPFFNSESVEDLSFLPNQTKLWKIHGSLGWKSDEHSKKVVRSNSCDDDIFIYPSVIKYHHSKKQPYESLMDRLSNFLKVDDSLLIVCGYSFGDEHINARIKSALSTNTSSHVIFLLFDKQKQDEKISYLLNQQHPIYEYAIANRKISVYGMESAIIGGKLAKWKLRREPTPDDTVQVNLYFDESFDDSKELGEHEVGTEDWTGEGEFVLPDFAKLTAFLNTFALENNI